MRPLIHFAAATAAIALLPAATVPPALAPGLQSIRAAELESNLTFLASDPLRGRLSLSTGSEVAVEWIKSEFEKAGLKPAASGSYLQPVPLWEFRNDQGKSFLSIDVKGTSKTFRYPEIYGQFPDDLNISGPVVFAGFGITAPELNYDDYKSINASGKIVLIFDHEPQENDPNSIFNGLGNTRYATRASKY